MRELREMTVGLRLQNDDLLQSLIYQLERQFNQVRFSLSDGSQGLRCVSEDFIPEDLIRNYIESFEAGFLRWDKKLKSDVSWETGSCREVAQLPRALMSSDVKGAFFLDSRTQGILKSLDTLFETFCLSLGAQCIRVPSLISAGHLSRCHYLPKQSHQVSFLHSSQGESLHTCLTPAACLPLYGALEQHVFAGPEIFTFNNQVYRSEGGLFSENEFDRSWEYPVRECVIFTDGESNQYYLSLYSDFMRKFCERFLDCARMNSASDTFFHREAAQVAFHQLMFKTKYEINYLGLNEFKLALSSINFHGDSFCQEYDIQIFRPGQRAHSLCIGWGLARTMKSLISSGKIHFQDLEREISVFTQEFVNHGK